MREILFHGASTMDEEGPTTPMFGRMTGTITVTSAQVVGSRSRTIPMGTLIKWGANIHSIITAPIFMPRMPTAKRWCLGIREEPN